MDIANHGWATSARSVASGQLGTTDTATRSKVSHDHTPCGSSTALEHCTGLPQLLAGPLLSENAHGNHPWLGLASMTSLQLAKLPV